MKHAQAWSVIVFALALGLQIQAHAKASETRLAQEIAANDAYTSPYEMSTSARAGTPSLSKSLVSFEPTFGLTMSTYTGATGNYSFTPRAGYSGGVGVLVGRGNFQFESGLLYSERGGKESFEMGIRKWDIEYKNSFIEVPLMARYNFETSKETRIFVKAGVVVGVLQNSVGNVSNAQNVSSNPAAYGYGYGSYGYNGAYYNPNDQVVNDGNTKSYFNTMDIRYAGAIGGIVRINRTLAWTLQGDYQTSISKSSESTPNGYVGVINMDLKSITYGLNTGILISI